jgi:hypothetical protein
MDSTKFSPLYEHVRRSRPTTVGRIAPHPQQITAVAVHFSRLSAPMYAHEKVTLSAVAESIARLSGYRYAGIFDANKHSGPEISSSLQTTHSCSTRRGILASTLPTGFMTRLCLIPSPKRKPSRTG